MATSERYVVVGVFRDPAEARAAIEALRDARFGGEDVSVLMPDRSGASKVEEAQVDKAGEGAATGAVLGALVGGLGGFLAGASALAIPIIGPVIAAGAFATALAGLAVGAAVGAIAGALIGMGIPEDEAQWYEQEARAGRTLVTVRADGRYDEARNILRRHGAYDVESRDTVGGTAQTTGSPVTTDR